MKQTPQSCENRLDGHQLYSMLEARKMNIDKLGTNEREEVIEFRIAHTCMHVHMHIHSHCYFRLAEASSCVMDGP